MTWTDDSLKRMFDVQASLAGLVLLGPAMVAIATLVKVTSRGPVLYTPLRGGLHNVPFQILKFRTMVVDADKIGGGSTAKNDPRITRIGHFLRRYKLDELPQLINVLIGDMSLVGPRPELLQYTALYEGEERLILTVRPGITDYASIEFRNLAEVLGAEDADNVYETRVLRRKNALRIKYAREHTFRGDLVLIFRTLLQIARG